MDLIKKAIIKRTNVEVKVVKYEDLDDLLKNKKFKEIERFEQENNLSVKPREEFVIIDTLIDRFYFSKDYVLMLGSRLSRTIPIKTYNEVYREI